MEPVWEKTPFHNYVTAESPLVRYVTYGPTEPRWIRIELGDNENEMDGSKAEWCFEHVYTGDFKLRDVGFTWSNYVIDFRHESDATMFLLRWGVNSS